MMDGTLRNNADAGAQEQVKTAFVKTQLQQALDEASLQNIPFTVAAALNSAPTSHSTIKLAYHYEADGSSYGGSNTYTPVSTLPATNTGSSFEEEDKPVLSEGGHDQVFIDYLNPDLTPEAGFETTGLLQQQLAEIDEEGLDLNLAASLSLNLNQAPIALNDVATTNEDTPLNNINVLANDTDPDGDALTVTSAAAANGTVSINADGSLNYTPDSNFNGTDTITYAISDGNGGTDTATVTVTVTPKADLTAADDSFVTNEDVAINGSVATNDSTTSGGTLNFTLNSGVSNGTVVLNNNGSFTYTPNLNYVGPDSFTYQVQDSLTGESSIQTVNITVQPFSPLTAADDNYQVDEDFILSGDVSVNDSTTSGGTLSFVVNTDVSNGTLILLSDGRFNYTPDSNFNGSDSFTYTVTDPVSGDSSVQTVNITVNPVDDLLAADDSFTINEDSSLSNTVASNDSTTSGGSLSFALNTGVSNGTLVLNSDGSFDYTPDSNFNGSDSFTYIVTDAASGENKTQTVLITVNPVNDAPVLGNGSVILAEVDLSPDTSDSGSITFSDVEGDALTMTLLAPADSLYSGTEQITWSGGNTNTLIGSAGGSEVIRIVIDNSGNYTVTLSDVLDHPVAGTADVIDFDVTVQATDGVATSFATLNVAIADDIPVTTESSSLFTISSTNLTASGNVLGASGTYGADGGYVETVKLGGYTYSYDAELNTITQTGYSDLVSAYSFNGTSHELTIETYKGETLVVNMLSADYSYSTTGLANVSDPAASDPVVSINSSGDLLGIVGAEALGLIDLSADQVLTAADADNDISEVVVSANALISIGIGSYYLLAYSAEMAAEFGLQVVADDNIFSLLGITTQSYSSLTITAIDGGSIDNSQLNEFLATVYVEEFGLLNLGVTPTMTISATDSQPVTVSDSDVDLLSLSLLGSDSLPDGLIEGNNTDDTLAGTAGNDRMYGYQGNDDLSGLAGNDILRGGAGNDSLDGGSGNDIIIGGIGNDALTGGSGVDVFKWEQADSGAIDTITDFDSATLANGGDILDLATLLDGEGKIDTNPGNLSNYLHFELSGTDTIIYISTDGDFSGGYAPAAVDQQIVLQNTDLVTAYADDQEIIAALIADGKLLVDEADSSTSMLGGHTDVDFTVTDSDGDIDSTTVSFDSSGQAVPVDTGNSAPEVQASDNALLGLIGLSTLNLIDFSDQDLNAVDVDGNLQRVQIQYTAFIGLGAYTLTASSALAEELGLQVTIENDIGILGLINPSSTLTITALDGGTIDNLAINELLATVEFNDGGSVLAPSLLTLNVLNATTITATDSEGLSSSDSLASLTDINLLDSLTGHDNIQEGSAANDTLTGTAESDRLYGYGGDDTLSGGAGADLLRGGLGDDTIHGGDGNDLIIGGQGNDTLYGDAGADVFSWQAGDDTANPTDTIMDFNSADGDVLNLADLLVDEESNPLADYLSFSFDGSDTTIDISADGSGSTSQTIILDSVDLTAAGTLTDQQILDSLLANNNLITD